MPAPPEHPGPGRPSASARYLAWLYSPAPQQMFVQALLALEREIADLLRPGREHHISHVRLEWWQGECERYANGSPVHPITKALAESCTARMRIEGFLAAATWDLAAATFQTRNELEAYCDCWGAAMTASLATCAGSRSIEVARKLGGAMREIELIGDLAHDARVGRIRLPLDELGDLEPRVIASPPWPSDLAERLAERLAVLDATIAEHVRTLPPEEQAPLRGLLVWAALAQSQARRMRRDLPQVVRAGRKDVLAEGWRAWRAARAAGRGRLQLN